METRHLTDMLDAWHGPSLARSRASAFLADTSLRLIGHEPPLRPVWDHLGVWRTRAMCLETADAMAHFVGLRSLIETFELMAQETCVGLVAMATNHEVGSFYYLDGRLVGLVVGQKREP